MENILNVAKYILDRTSCWTDKKIQKLTYYAYSWYIVLNNKNCDNIINRLVAEHPEAWIHGPVFYRLYEEMTHNRDNFLKREVDLQEETKNFLNKIIEIYGKYTGNQLEDMTHNELPWQEARENLSSHEKSRKPLRDTIIYSYYSS